MSWTYEQLTGKLYDPQGNYYASGYAGGNCGKNPEGLNNTQYESVHSVGPLPRGEYELGNPIEGTKLGAFAIPLIPDPANEMFGRGGFFFHGDNSELNHSASEGCMVFPRTVRDAVYASDDRKITVTDVKET